MMITRPLHVPPHLESVALLPAPETRELLNRVRSEYNEMPGLCLTSPQARRLWALDDDTCRTVLGMLVREGYLRESPSGYIRAR